MNFLSGSSLIVKLLFHQWDFWLINPSLMRALILTFKSKLLSGHLLIRSKPISDIRYAHVVQPPLVAVQPILEIVFVNEGLIIFPDNQNPY